MGQGMSVRSTDEKELFTAVENGNLGAVEAILKRDSALFHHSTLYDCNTPLHIAASNRQIEVLSFLLDRHPNPDLLNKRKQTPLMLAAMSGKVSCVTKLIEAGANIMTFDSPKGRTCLHYAAKCHSKHGSECLKAILTAARTSPVATSWGYSHFVNIRDGKGATPLHLAACKGRPLCVHVLLENGAIVSASTGTYGFPGSTALHLAAKNGSLDCLRELLAWGADRLQKDDAERIPYKVALMYNQGACARLLSPSSPSPLVWPSDLKLITELNPEVKILLEYALMEANRERENAIFKRKVPSLPSPTPSLAHSDSVDHASEETVKDPCDICSDQIISIEVQDCHHRMCARCMLALCCQIKSNPTIPVCPFCRSNITGLLVAEGKFGNDKGELTKAGCSSSFRPVEEPPL